MRLVASRSLCSLFLTCTVTLAAGGDEPATPPRRDSGVAPRDAGGMVPPPTDCGDERQACCRGTTCNAGLTCSAGSCTAAASCGRDAQPCCAGGACTRGLVCQADVCSAPTMC